MPEDDQDVRRLNELKSTHVRSEGYDAPTEQTEASTSIFDSDIGYHSRYGDPDDEVQTLPQGPLGDHQARTDMGYRDRFFHN